MALASKTYRGFTLIELLVVIAIIGLLSTIVTASLGSAKSKARDSKRISDIKTIQTALALYYNDNGMYPRNIYIINTNDPPFNGLAPTYIPVVPKDPLAGSFNCAISNPNGRSECYHYYGLSAGTNGICNGNSAPPVLYHLGAGLENDSNQVLNEDVVADVNLTSYGSFRPCSPGPTSFDGDAAACSTGGGAVAPDTCYSLTP